jgi:hypothetical protein
MATSVDDYIELAGQLIDSASARATARHRLHAGAHMIFESSEAIHEWQRVLLQAARTGQVLDYRLQAPEFDAGYEDQQRFDEDQAMRVHPAADAPWEEPIVLPDVCATFLSHSLFLLFL